MSETNPSNRDPKDMIDPAHPVPFDADDVEVDDEDSGKSDAGNG